MSKLIPILLVILAFNIAFGLFVCEEVGLDGQCVPSSSFWSFIQSPQNLDNTNLWDVLFGTSAGLAAIATGIVVVGSLFSKSEMPLYIGITLALMSTGNIFIKLFTQVRQIDAYGGSTVVATMMAMIIVSPLIISWIFLFLDWGRGR